jgi:hypothetical protein
MKEVRCVKVFDENWKCRDFQYEVGKTYKMLQKDISLCDNGFHACRRAIDCFNYKSFDFKNKVAEVILSGRVIEGDDKIVASKITIVREITWQELLTMVNSGKNNTGNCNSGNWNSGYRNSGNWNSGNWNSGYRNSGNWNKTHHSSGFFNTKEQTVFIFNRDSGVTYSEFMNKYDIPSCLYFDITKWIDYSDMTEQEKAENPNSDVRDGYLKSIPYKEAAIASISKASEAEKRLIRALPNYDPDVFEEIFGIRI